MPSSIFFNADLTHPLSSSFLHPSVQDVVHDKLQIDTLFDMQHQVHTFMLRNISTCQSHDFILCAPTGSGKTLAYALPILHHLHQPSSNIPPLLRALIVVPTRDLARQIAEVFTILSQPLRLHVALATGNTTTITTNISSTGEQPHATKDISDEALLPPCDILIATPTRLTFHAQRSSSFSLPHIRYLVLDESDRLLDLADSHWLQTIMPLLGKPPPSPPTSSATNPSPFNMDGEDAAFDDLSVNWRPTTGLLALSTVPTVASIAHSAYSRPSDDRICKILVSATHSLNPSFMVYLDLRHPTTFQSTPTSTRKRNNASTAAAVKFVVPDTMTESTFIVPELRHKLPALLHLLGMTTPPSSTYADKLGGKTTGVKLIFANSIDAAHRLTRLLELSLYAMGRKTPIFEMSGNLSDARRNYVIDFLKRRPDLANEEGESGDNVTCTPIIVSSDVLSRGMDIFTIDCVINYDAPHDLRTYLHRSGRTARAGRPGAVLSIVQKKQARHFRLMLAEAERGGKQVVVYNLFSPVILPPEVKQPLSLSLSKLKRVIQREELNLLSRDAELPSYALYELQQLHTEERSGGGTNEVAKNKEEHSFAVVEEHGGDVDTTDEQMSFGRKRKRNIEDIGARDVSGDGSDEEDDHEDGDDGSDLGEDSFSDLLYAQIAKSILLET